MHITKHKVDKQQDNTSFTGMSLLNITEEFDKNLPIYMSDPEPIRLNM